MYIFCSKVLADVLNIKKNELQKISVDIPIDDLYAWHQLSLDDVFCYILDDWGEKLAIDRN